MSCPAAPDCCCRPRGGGARTDRSGSTRGSAITDEQIAAVLTYVRREWGQTGTPVDPATVSSVRTLTKDRTRPWTDAELTALLDK